MFQDTLKRVQVWSGRLRLLHWVLAAAVIVLTATGWLLRHEDLAFRPEVAEVHRNTAWVLLSVLTARAYLLVFGQRSEQWRDFIPGATQLQAMGQMLRYYASWTRSPLPAYYAHNPLWAPVYLILYALLAVQAISGLLSLGELHVYGYWLIAVLSLLHLVAVFLHDWKGTGSEVSAMISGYKIFVVNKPMGDVGEVVQSVPVDSLRRGSGSSGRSP